MQSTGEVIGIHADPRVAMAKALVGASLRPPMPSVAGVSHPLVLAVDRRSRQGPPRRAGALACTSAGYGFAATSGTARSLRVLGYEVEEVDRLGEHTAGRSVIDAISSGDVLLVVNTPSPESRPVRDAGAIRLAATAEGILCLTSIDTALAAAGALDAAVSEQIDDVRSLDEWVKRDVATTA